MAEITLHLPFALSVNRLWRSGRGRVYKSEAYLDWEGEAYGLWLQQKNRLKTKKIHGFYSLHIVFCQPDKRHRDLDNLVKILSDFSQLVGVVDNDSYCRDLHLVYGTQKEAPYGSCLTFKSMA